MHLTIDGELVQTTAEHPFFTQEQGWVDASKLWQGAHVRKLNGSYGVVQGVEVVQQGQTMYNLTVAQAHTFFVGQEQWLVHNSKDCNRTLAEIKKDGASKFFEGDKGIQNAYKHLEKHHGVPQTESSRLLHEFKQKARMGAADNAVITPTGDVYDSRTGEWIGSITGEFKTR